MENVVLIGMPGCGKSTVGVILAKTLGVDFIDTDLVIQKREGGLLQELLNSRGMDAFLDAESAAVRSVDCAGAVIATGGSVVYRPEAMAHLKKREPQVNDAALQRQLSTRRETTGSVSRSPA